MYADAIVAAILQADLLEGPVKSMTMSAKVDRMHFKVCILRLILRSYFFYIKMNKVYYERIDLQKLDSQKAPDTQEGMRRIPATPLREGVLPPPIHLGIPSMCRALLAQQPSIWWFQLLIP